MRRRHRLDRAEAHWRHRARRCRRTELTGPALNEPKRRAHYVVYADVAEPVRRRSTGGCLSRKRSDGGGFVPETRAENVAVKPSRRIDLNRAKFVVAEPVHFTCESCRHLRRDFGRFVERLLEEERTMATRIV